jgi:hypothetical protein
MKSKDRRYRYGYLTAIRTTNLKPGFSAEKDWWIKFICSTLKAIPDFSDAGSKITVSIVEYSTNFPYPTKAIGN